MQLVLIYTVQNLIKHTLLTADCGIKHGLRYQMRTKHYRMGIKHGLRCKTRTAD